MLSLHTGHCPGLIPSASLLPASDAFVRRCESDFGARRAGGTAKSKAALEDRRDDVCHHSTNLKKKIEPGITYCRLSKL